MENKPRLSSSCACLQNQDDTQSGTQWKGHSKVGVSGEVLLAGKLLHILMAVCMWEGEKSGNSYACNRLSDNSASISTSVLACVAWQDTQCRKQRPSRPTASQERNWSATSRTLPAQRRDCGLHEASHAAHRYELSWPSLELTACMYHTYTCSERCKT